MYGEGHTCTKRLESIQDDCQGLPVALVEAVSENGRVLGSHAGLNKTALYSFCDGAVA